MHTFKELKRASKALPKDGSKSSLVILGDSATQFLAQAIRGTLALENMALDVVDTDYDQIQLQVIDDNSDLYLAKPRFVLIFMCTEKLYDTFCDTPLDARTEFATNAFARISGYWNQIHQRSDASILQTLFPYFGDETFGNYGAKIEASFSFQLQKLNLLLSQGMVADGGVFPIDLPSIASRRGEAAYRDPKFYYSARLAISTEALPEVAYNVVSVVQSILGRSKKCVISDLDNTLWGGVIGDDGLEGIQIGELGDGRAFSDIQAWLKELTHRGIILAICSKNNEDTAKEPFEKHPEMTLHLDDISIFVANWQNKASNIEAIRETLNIGMDSIVFLDDNPFERDSVRSLIPDITVPELPEDPALWIDFLRSENLFETASYSRGDRDRTKQYQAEAGRRQLQSSFESFDDYLESLEMIAEAKPFDEFHRPRIAQLTQRSNQFNLRTVRYTEAEIEKLATSEDYLTLYFTLKDKFGDHGLISVVVMEKRNAKEVFIDTWLMSCRVLKRGMEEFIVNKIVETAAKAGFETIVGEYLPTPKNAMVKDIYEQLGFERIDDGTFSVNVNAYKSNSSHIKEEED